VAPVGVDGTAIAAQIEGLGRGNADLGTGEGRHRQVALARDSRGRDIDDRERVLAVLLGVPQARQRVGRLARLRYEDCEIALAQWRFTVAELGRYVDFDRQARETLERVFGDESIVKGCATGRQREPCAP
jgi:hypothetical protein